MNHQHIQPNPRVTIVTPSYNQGQFIEETIQSVLAQTYPHVEYIVVDGNSTDDTHHILDRYVANINRLIIEPDGGQSDAINKGFRLATGKLVGWLNSDDVLLPYAVEATVACFLQHPTCSVFYGDVKVINEQGCYLYSLEPPKHLTFRMLVNGRGLIAQPGSFYAMDLVRQVGGVRQQFHRVMDRDIWLRLLQLGAGCHVGEYVALFRRHGQAKTSASPLQLLEEKLALDREFGPRLFSRRTLQIARLRLKCTLIKMRRITGIRRQV